MGTRPSLIVSIRTTADHIITEKNQRWGRQFASFLESQAVRIRAVVGFGRHRSPFEVLSTSTSQPSKPKRAQRVSWLLDCLHCSRRRRSETDPGAPACPTCGRTMRVTTEPIK